MTLVSYVEPVPIPIRPDYTKLHPVVRLDCVLQDAIREIDAIRFDGKALMEPLGSIIEKLIDVTLAVAEGPNRKVFYECYRANQLEIRLSRAELGSVEKNALNTLAEVVRACLAFAHWRDETGEAEDVFETEVRADFAAGVFGQQMFAMHEALKQAAAH